MSCLDVAYIKFAFIGYNSQQTYRTQGCERPKTEVCLEQSPWKTGQQS